MNAQYLKNVFFNDDLKPWKTSNEDIYGIHLCGILQKVEAIMGDSYYDFKFLYYNHKMRRDFKCIGMTGKNVILLMMGDEKSTLPEDLCDHFFAIIKPYYPLEKNHRNIISFPVGYSNSSALTHFVPFDERKYDASYAGNFLGNRLDFYRQFTWLRYLPPFQIRNKNLRTLYFKILVKLKLFKPEMFMDFFGKSICYWSGGFAKGLSREEYADLMSESRIALCPKGFISTECYRLMEAMRLGCVIVSDELPPSRWYKNSPILVTKDWLHIKKYVSNLMSNPARMAEIHGQTLDWWNDVCSDEAVARYLAEEILRLRQI